MRHLHGRRARRHHARARAPAQGGRPRSLRRRPRAGPPRGAVRRRPGRDHYILDPRCRPRLPAAVGAGRRDRDARPVPRSRLPAGGGDRSRSDGAPARAPRCPRGLARRWCRSSFANLGTACAEFAGVAAATELAGISRYLSVPIAAFGVTALVLRVELPPRRAHAAGTERRLRRLRHRRPACASGLERSCARPRRAEHARWIATACSRSPRWSAPPLAPWGLAVHRLVCGRQAPRRERAALRAHRCRQRRDHDRRDRRVRRRRLRRDAARRRAQHRRRARCRDRARAARRLARGDAVRRRPARSGAACGIRRSALDGVLGQRGGRPSGRLDDPCRRRRCSMAPTSPSRASQPASS